jgi:hypothetical protein
MLQNYWQRIQKAFLFGKTNFFAAKEIIFVVIIPRFEKLHDTSEFPKINTGWL